MHTYRRLSYILFAWGRKLGETVFVLLNQQQLSKIAQLLEQGLLKPHASAIFPLNQAAKAHQLVESGHTKGKIVLEIE
ncbi:MAG TPA: zinc-binding dehydrogenase [Patescibacteria group bacterium]|nr:zinc-binding dehydrogenase [Gammaproteobacteria bacterium]HWA52516.1 zinc-binding dehydrogenase [Patescibacteria group bacterium]